MLCFGSLSEGVDAGAGVEAPDDGAGVAPAVGVGVTTVVGAGVVTGEFGVEVGTLPPEDGADGAGVGYSSLEGGEDGFPGAVVDGVDGFPGTVAAGVETGTLPPDDGTGVPLPADGVDGVFCDGELAHGVLAGVGVATPPEGGGGFPLLVAAGGWLLFVLAHGVFAGKKPEKPGKLGKPPAVLPAF